MFHTVQQIVSTIDFETISKERQEILQELIDYMLSKREKGEDINLNFICTHNSRRSQFSQVWANVAACYYNVAANSFSSGVEVTAFNPRVAKSLERFGFKADFEAAENPKYKVYFDFNAEPVTAFSKLIEDPVNPKENFAAIMTCDHADENCPIVVGAEKRIAVRYNDPKKYDETPLESTFYDYRSFQIATELFYVFSKIS